MAVIYRNIVLLALLYLQIFSFIMTKEISISETVKCFDNTSETNLALLTDKCSIFFEKCDDSCIDYMDTFNTCTDTCKKPATESNANSLTKVDWECYEACIFKASNENFRNLIKCIYEPCQIQFNKSSKWYITVITILIMIVVIGFGFIFIRKIRKEKIASISESTFNKF
jgi:hypothetical protein